MKKILIGLLAFMLVFSLAGCGTKEKLEEKAGEALAEKIVEQAGGGDIDIDGDKVTVKGQNGEAVTFGSNKWPTSELANIIPEFKNGTVNAVLERPDSVVISLESVQKEDASFYFETIKKDFPQDVFEMNAEDTASFSGKNDVGVNVTLMYMSEMLTITVTAPRQ
ncbi:MAG: hypothetical protein GX795_12245 [Firmicutes bacterium]|jgi:hypothetical protein|nr:hypothetical protein [Bacillota bacterium]